MQVIVELLFNLLWVGLSAGLIGIWIGSRRRWADVALRPGVCIQVAALALVIVILFPVVSLTDDLAACATPAEVEHLVRRDLQDHMGGSDLSSGTLLAAELISLQNAPALQTIWSLSPSMEIGIPREEFLSTVANRAPPRD